MTDKSTRWAITVYEEQFPLFQNIPKDHPIIAEYGYQVEICPETGRTHYQGYIRTWRQVRFTQLRKALPGVHIEIAREWFKLLSYCKKRRTRDLSGSAVHVVHTQPPLTMADALTLLVPYAPTGNDIQEHVKVHKKLMTPKEEFWFCVNGYLRESQNYESIALFTSPLIQTAWTNTKNIWIDRQTDRQNEEEPPGSEADGGDARAPTNEIISSTIICPAAPLPVALAANPVARPASPAECVVEQ